MASSTGWTSLGEPEITRRILLGRGLLLEGLTPGTLKVRVRRPKPATFVDSSERYPTLQAEFRPGRVRRAQGEQAGHPVPDRPPEPGQRDTTADQFCSSRMALTVSGLKSASRPVSQASRVWR